MLMLISPAKSLDMQAIPPELDFTSARFLEDSRQLIDRLQALTPDEIQKLMGISTKLANLNYQRFQEWSPLDTARQCPALYAFQGDVYQGLGAESLSIAAVQFAQLHLRILSGLYGLLRPLDQMQAYRLEMGTKLANERGGNLYTFWGDKISTCIQQDMRAIQSTELVNLASNEYFKVVKPKLIGHKVITPVFKDFKNGKYKVISFYAKKARGMMVRFAVQNKITQAEGLKAFVGDGYHFDAGLSNATQWVFTRDKVM